MRVVEFVTLTQILGGEAYLRVTALLFCFVARAFFTLGCEDLAPALFLLATASRLVLELDFLGVATCGTDETNLAMSSLLGLDGA